MSKSYQIKDSDFRRASALLTHWTRNDRDGVNSVLDEAEAAGTMRQLAWCIPAMVTGVQDGWTHPDVSRVLESFTTAFALREMDGE